MAITDETIQTVSNRPYNKKVLTRDEIIDVLEGTSGLGSGVTMGERMILSALLLIDDKLSDLGIQIDNEIVRRVRGLAA